MLSASGCLNDEQRIVRAEQKAPEILRGEAHANSNTRTDKFKRFFCIPEVRCDAVWHPGLDRRGGISDGLLRQGIYPVDHGGLRFSGTDL